MRTSTNTAVRYLGGITIASSLILGLGATAASASAPASKSGDCEFGEHLVEVWAQAPAALQSDLKALRATPEGERRSAAREIRNSAITGEYGAQVQEKAQKVRAMRVKAFAHLPAELRADLRVVKAAEPADRLELVEQIADDALAGGYGPKAQATAERIRSSDAWQDCVAR